MALWIIVPFFFLVSSPIATADNNTCPLYFSGYDGSCMIGSEFSDGDVIFGILGNIHETENPSPLCGRVSPTQVQAAEMVRWIIGKLQGYVNGVTFGYRLQDSCRRVELVTRGMVSLVPEIETRDCMAPRVVGIIDQHTSDQASSLAAGLRDTTIPIVSTYATAPSLSNKANYPTFLRTIQPDSVSVLALRDIIVQLDMKYIVLVHTSDFYGRQGKDLMTAALHERNICIASTLEITNDPATVTAALRDMETRLNKVGEQGILGVIYYGQMSEGQELARQANGLSNNRGRRFLWVMSEGIGREDYLFKNLENIRRNIITITPMYHEISEFTQYWLALLNEYIQNPALQHSTHIRGYIEQLLQCNFDPGTTKSCQDSTVDDLQDAYVESGFSVIVLDAVYAMAAAVKNLHDEKCGPNSEGVCQLMAEALATDFLSAVKAVDFSYPHDFPFVPGQFRSTPRRIAFNQTTYDPLVSESSYSHIIYKYTCTSSLDCYYRKIAQYQNNVLEAWDLEQVNFYPYPDSDQPLAALDLQTIFCTSFCIECHFTGPIPFAYIPGEFLIAAILPFHQKMPGEFLQCNSSFFRSRIIHSTEALLYAVALFNDPNGEFQGHPLRGRLGVIVVDSCYDGVYAHHRIADIHSKQILLTTPGGEVIDSDSIVLYFGGHYSSTAIGVTSVLQSLNLVQMGYAATSVKLFDFPHFLRTIPADDVQARVIIDFVKEMGWQQVAILYQDDSYGQNGYKNLLEFASAAHICVAANISIPVSITSQDVIRVMTKLLTSTRRIEVVILFAGYDEILTILTQVTDSDKHFTWIGSEAWGHSSRLLEAGMEVLGAITVAPLFPTYQGYNTYFKSLRPDTNSRNPYFNTFWERNFQCFLINSATAEAGGALCDQSLSLDDYTDFYEGAQLIIPAVFAAAIGIGDVLNHHAICDGQIANCPAIRTEENLQKIVSAIKDVSLTDHVTRMTAKVFTSRGDGNIDYVVNNIQKVTIGQQEEYNYVQVAEFRLDSGLRRNEQRVIFYDQFENEKEVMGTCIQDCELCSADTGTGFETVLIEDGSLLLLAILPVHDRPGAEQVSVNGLKSVEAFRIAMNRMNAEGILNGVKIGYQVRDSFSNEDIGSWYALTTMSSTAELLQLPILDTTLLGYLTAGPDAVTSGVNQVTNNHHRLHVDTTASISDVFGNDTEDYFVSLAYSTSTEAEAIVSVLQAFEVRYIGIIYTDDLLMMDKFQQLRNEAKMAGLCTISELMLSSGSTSQYIRDSLRSWFGSYLHISVTLLLTNVEIAELALSEYDSVSSGSSHTVLMGGEDLQTALASISGTFTDLPHKAVTVTAIRRTPSTTANGIVSDFHQLTTVDSVGSLINPWFDETIWSEVLAVTSVTGYDDVIESMVAAVYSVAHGLADYCGTLDIGPACLPQLGNAGQVERLTQLVKSRAQSSEAYVLSFDISLHTYDNIGAKWTESELGTYHRLTSTFSARSGVDRASVGLGGATCPLESGCPSCDVVVNRGVAGWLVATIVVAALVIVAAALFLGYFCYRKGSKKGPLINEVALTELAPLETPSHSVSRPLPSPPVTESIHEPYSDMSTPHSSNTSKYMQGSSNGSGQMVFHPTVPQGMVHPAVSSRRHEVPFSHIDQTYGRHTDPYNSSMSSNHDELTNIFINTGSETYQNPVSLAHRHPNPDTYVADAYISPASISPRYLQTYSLGRGVPVRPAPEEFSIDNIHEINPKLYHSLLEMFYKREGSMEYPLTMPIPRKEGPKDTHGAFDNLGFVGDYGTRTNIIPSQGHHQADSDSGVAVDHAGPDTSSLRPPVLSNHQHPSGTAPGYEALPHDIRAQNISPRLVDAGTDSPVFLPIANHSSSPTTENSQHNDSRSTASPISDLSPTLSGNEVKPKIPARPSKAAIRQASLSPPMVKREPIRRISPSSMDDYDSQSTV